MNQKGFTMIVGLITVVLLITVGVLAYSFFSKQKAIENDNPVPTITPVVTQAPDPAGTVYLQAKDGLLTNVSKNDSFTYLAETSRGFEAYLAAEGAQLTIPFNISAGKVGTYEVSLYTSDDGVWDNGTRNATVFFDNTQKLLYNHISKDTQGMVWVSIGNVTLTEGDHFVMVTKRETTAGAFSFTSIKLVPVD